MFFRTIVVITMVYCQYSIAYDYCTGDKEKQMCGAQNHIVCDPKFGKHELGPLYGVVPMTPLLKRQLIREHNTVRNNISCGLKRGEKKFKKAARMRRVIWDDELAFLAGKHVAQCTEQKNECIQVHRFQRTGQNICKKIAETEVEIVDVITHCMRVWFLEYNLMPDVQGIIDEYSRGSDEFSASYGRLALIINEYTSRIGCAMAACVVGDMWNMLLVCNYDMKNHVGKPVYTTDENDAATNCESWRCDRSSQYECLCTNNGRIFQPYHSASNGHRESLTIILLALFCLERDITFDICYLKY